MRAIIALRNRLRVEAPDLFLPPAAAQGASMLFSEFLPTAALLNPAGHPWGKYGAGDHTPQQKVIIVSFRKKEELSYFESDHLEFILQSLKHCNFKILIAMGDRLYDFNESPHNASSNLSRQDIRTIALADPTLSIPERNIYFIDDTQIELDKHFLWRLAQLIKKAILENAVYLNNNTAPLHSDLSEHYQCVVFENTLDQPDRFTDVKNAREMIFTRKDFSEERLQHRMRAVEEKAIVFGRSVVDEIYQLITDETDWFLLSRHEEIREGYNIIKSELSPGFSHDGISCEFCIIISDERKSVFSLIDDYNVNFDTLLFLYRENQHITPKIILHVIQEFTLSIAEILRLTPKDRAHIFGIARDLKESFADTEKYVGTLLQDTVDMTSEYTTQLMPINEHTQSYIDYTELTDEQASSVRENVAILFEAKRQRKEKRLAQLRARPCVTHLEALHTIALERLPSANEEAFIIAHANDIKRLYTDNAHYLENILTLCPRFEKMNHLEIELGAAYYHELMPNCPNLSVLVLNLSHMIDQKVTIDLNHFEKLNELILGNPQFSTARFVSDQCAALSTLTLGGSKTDIQVPLEMIITLVRSFPQISVLNINCIVTPAGSLEQLHAIFPGLKIRVSAKQLPQIKLKSSTLAAADFSTEQRPQKSALKKSIFSAVNSEELRTKADFDTTHCTDKRQLESACEYLGEGDAQFEFTRDALFSLNNDGEIKEIFFHSTPYHIQPRSRADEKDQTDCYRFDKTVCLAAGQRIRLSSLSPFDDLISLKLNGIDLTEADVEVAWNRIDGFFSMTLKKDIEGKLSYVLHARPIEKIDIAQLPHQLREIIQNLLAFESSGSTAIRYPKNATSQQKLEIMYAERKGACRHRSAIFLHLLSEFKIRHPKYSYITARAVQRSGIHMNIEISLNGGDTYFDLDLGGHVMEKEYVPTLPPIPFSAHPRDSNEPSEFSPDSLQFALKEGKNSFFGVKETTDAYHLLQHVRQASSGRPTFYIHAPEQLRISLANLSLNTDEHTCHISDPPAGLFFEFLRQYHADAPVIIVDLSDFTLDEIVQFNSLLDTQKRMLDTTPIPKMASIVCIHSKSEKMLTLLSDTSFTSRYQSGRTHDFSHTAIPAHEIAQDYPEPTTENTISIDLHYSPRWRDLLVGKACIKDDRLIWEEGPLLAALRNTSLSHIHLLHAPESDDFKLFMKEFNARQSITYLNQSISNARSVLLSTTESTLTETISVQAVNHPSRNTYLVNSTTFEQCLYGKKITSGSTYITLEGLLERYALKKEKLTLCITDNLSVSQWSLLTAAAKKYSTDLFIEITPSVKPPQNAAVIDKTQTSHVRTQKNVFIQTKNTDAVANDIAKHNGAVMTVDFSELSSDELLYRIHHSVKGKDFYFREQFSDIWRALQNGDTVVLKGKLSSELFHTLETLYADEPYLMFEGAPKRFPGKLFIVTDEHFKKPDWISTTPAPDVKPITLSVPSFTPLHTDPNDFSLEACESFERYRRDLVLHHLDTAPFVVLEGPPAVGKSYFVNALKEVPGVKIYREDQIKEWATDAFAGKKILLRDEINLRNTDCSQDRDLLNDPPSMLIDGKHYRLQGNCKIMYAQNPADYQGGRHEPKLFQDFPACKCPFGQMSKAFIFHRILKPIFLTVCDEKSAFIEAEKILTLHYDTMRSIRDLQAHAIRACTDIKYPPPPQPMNTTVVCSDINGFMVTPSRFKPYKEVLQLLQSREFKRDPATTQDGARYNGVNGLLLTGPPGVGKSDFIEKILLSENYTEVDLTATDAQLASGKVYFRLRTSLSTKEILKILDRAFQQGAIVLIDEIDSCALIEKYLNAYLTGEDTNGKRPQQPGFTVLSTGNGAHIPGRHLIAKPLQSRLMTLSFEEYPRADLMLILEASFVKPGLADDAMRAQQKTLIAYLVDEFLTQQNTSNISARPTFRELFELTKSFFNTMKEHDLTLTHDQSRFLLAHHAHIKFDSLVHQFRSKSWTPNTTLTEMEKFLTSPAQAGLFQSASTAAITRDFSAAPPRVR